MELTFLGTSAGVPTTSRNVTGLAVRHEGQWDLFDCGEATQHQLMRTHLSLARLRRIFISHLHGDHCYGLFGLVASLGVVGARNPVEIIGAPGVEEMVESVLRLSDTHLPFELRFTEVTHDGQLVVDDDGGTVEAVQLDHRVRSYGWWINEAARPGAFDVDAATALGVEPGPDFGRLQQGSDVAVADGSTVTPSQVLGPPRPGRTAFIAGDNRDPDLVVDRTGALDLLVHEATFTEDVLDRIGHDWGHSTARRVAAAAQRGGVRNLVLTHFSPRYATTDEVRDEARSVYHGELVLAEDLDRFELGHDATLT